MVNAIKRNKGQLTRLSSLLMTFVMSLTLALTIGMSAKEVDSLKVYASGGNYDVTMDSSGTVGITGDLVQTDGATSWNNLIGKFKFFVAGVTGIGTVAMVLFFVYNFVKLGSTSDNDAARAKVIKGLVWSAIAAAGLGAVTVFVGFFLNAVR
ncbi:hypothetical protein [Clostridium sp.]|uniref:hypothetical protein n=1 Tax=Clostridium sp. TaxID=1506 RepID=UPI001B623F3A|nr:hypothetical protein [Clostridium sp.]MBP3915716.1 hypothetical protein [Clostridium sp.]